ncbi:galactitol 1-phosphate 5-dehydrogenase [Micromonospora sp. Llam0]|nr:galactitol 1-phosphate 5-dehydrogenase [Micromonospora sp. Llam0]
MVLDLNEVDPPVPRTGESIIQTRYAGICGSDTPKLLCPGDFTLPDPWRPGHEVVGADTDGRIVAVDPLVPCGDCQRCTAGDSHLCLQLLRIGWDKPGGFAEQMAAPAANLHPIPAGLDPLHAVLADPAAVAIHGIRCNLTHANANLAVIGAGAVGLLTALYASTLGHAVTIVHRAGTRPSAAIMRAIPAAFRPSSQLPAQAFDSVVDAATGADAAPLELALHLVRDGGSIVVQNAYHPQVQLRTPLRDILRRSVQLIGSFSYCRRHPEPDFSSALTLLANHPEQVRDLVIEAGHLTDLRRLLQERRRGSVRHAIATEPKA